MTTGDKALKALQDWKSKPDLRAEFRNSFYKYAAFVRNQLAGKVNIMGDKK